MDPQRIIDQDGTDLAAHLGGEFVRACWNPEVQYVVSIGGKEFTFNRDLAESLMLAARVRQEELTGLRYRVTAQRRELDRLNKAREALFQTQHLRFQWSVNPEDPFFVLRGTRVVAWGTKVVSLVRVDNYQTPIYRGAFHWVALKPCSWIPDPKQRYGQIVVNNNASGVATAVGGLVQGIEKALQDVPWCGYRNGIQGTVDDTTESCGSGI